MLNTDPVMRWRKREILGLVTETRSQSDFTSEDINVTEGLCLCNL